MFSSQVQLLVWLVALLIIVHLANIAMGGALNQFGVIPRSAGHWHHVLTAPFIHSDNAHLFGNLVGLMVFSALCIGRSIKFFLLSSLFIILVGGGLVWIFGRHASHIGASGWIFGLWSLTISIAWFDRKWRNIFLAAIVIFLYGNMIFGVLPGDPRVSFEMHLAGAIAGVICAFGYTIIRKVRFKI
jgi:membrane associated rhomboid family serine protease